jgi:RNA-directed DNA polymerase
LRRKLDGKEKTEPALSFRVIYDTIYWEDVIHHAFALAHANGGAPGVDGETFGAIEVAGREAWLAGFRQALRTPTYLPAPV